MGIFSSGNNTKELYVPVQPSRAYKALLSVINQDYGTKTSDDFTLSCTFTRGMSMKTYGENCSAQIVPSEGGATIRLSISPRKSGFGTDSSIQKLADDIFNKTVGLIRAE